MIYITCPVNMYTGGPTLAHQLCYTLNEQGISSKMLYEGVIKKGKSPIHKNYEHFHNPYEISIEDTNEDIIIILETKTNLIHKYKNAKKYIWWMSVDNYYVSLLTKFERLMRKIGKFSFDISKEMKKKSDFTQKMLSNSAVEHLVQSEYAKLFLEENGVKSEKIHYLTDYIEDEICELANKNKEIKRENVVLYNPKKGIEFTKKIMDAMRNESITFVPLINMTKSEVVDRLCTSKLYIDFGNHPGKDRFPREAVACGCCIITGMRGAAANGKDVPIPRKYKFSDTDSEIPQIVKMIKYISLNFDECSKDYIKYREYILKEKEIFEKEALELFKYY